MIGEGHGCWTWEDKLILRHPGSGMSLSIAGWCRGESRSVVVAATRGRVMEDEGRLLAEEVGRRRWACGLWSHQHGASWGEVGRGEGGSCHGTHGPRHGHVGRGVVGESRMVGVGVNWQHPFTILHQFSDGQLVGLLRAPPLGPAVLKPDLSGWERERERHEACNQILPSKFNVLPEKVQLDSS